MPSNSHVQPLRPSRRDQIQMTKFEEWDPTGALHEGSEEECKENAGKQEEEDSGRLGNKDRSSI